MAFQTGTATGYLDLYNKLRDFLTTDATLVAASENWTQIAGNGGVLVDGDEVVLQGPGLGGTDQILVGLDTSASVGGDYYNLVLRGLTSYNPANGALANQVNVSSPTVVHLWNQNIPYWFIANGRRFIVIARTSTVYQSAYAGFMLPYVLPTLWPYPLFVGGNSGQSTWRWSVTSPDMRSFFDPGTGGAYLMLPDILWYSFRNWSGSGSTDVREQSRNTMPYRWDLQQVRENLDGTYLLEPVSLVCSSPYAAQLGRLQGVYRVSGFGNAAENIITQGGVDHIVIPNVYRTTWDNYAAFALE